MPQYNDSKNMEVVKEMFYRLYNKEIYDNDLLQFSMSYLNYVGRKRDYITRVVSDELERWSSDVRSELRFTRRTMVKYHTLYRIHDIRSINSRRLYYIQ